MELNHLLAFYEVAKSGSFTEAARRLHISQSALSKSVALLEDSEGVKLLVRSKKGVTLTPIGAEVYQRSETIVQTVSEIRNTCRGTKETCEGDFRFGASDNVTNYLLVKPAQKLRAQHGAVVPGIFAGTPNEIVAALLNGEIEFGLFFTRVNAPQIVYEPLFPVPMAVVCHRRLLADPDKPTPASLRAVLRETGFVGSIRSQYQHHPSEELMKLMGDDPRIAFESNSQETQKRLCLAGGGVAFLARFMVEKELKDGTLAEIPLKNPIALDLLLARRRGRALSLSAKTFLEILKG